MNLHSHTDNYIGVHLYWRHKIISLLGKHRHSTGCSTVTAKEELFLGKDAFNQLGCWQDYTNRIVYIKQLKIHSLRKSCFKPTRQKQIITLQTKIFINLYPTQHDFQGSVVLFVIQLISTVFFTQ